MGSKSKTTKTTVPSTKKPSASEDGGIAMAKLTDGLAKMALKKKEDQITLISLIVHHVYIIKWYTKSFVDYIEVEFQHKGVNDPDNPKYQVSLKDSKTLQILCATPQMFFYPDPLCNSTDVLLSKLSQTDDGGRVQRGRFTWHCTEGHHATVGHACISQQQRGTAG
jgi:hypothetical protein